MKKIFIASDHIGIYHKAQILTHLSADKYDVVDLGPMGPDRVDYPNYAVKVCKNVLKHKNAKGILICGTGIGMSIMANRFRGIRAALCTNTYMAKMAVLHNDANIICIGARVIDEKTALSVVQTYLEETFEGGRHVRRIIKLDTLA